MLASQALLLADVFSCGGLALPLADRCCLVPIKACSHMCVCVCVHEEEQEEEEEEEEEVERPQRRC